MPHLNRLPSPGPRRHGQRGAAALIVVMVLFFVISMVAAYTGRNMIFEQKTSTNQYRSTQGFEAAEAGLEWALAQLNAGAASLACTPDAAGPNNFRDRYLQINADTGAIAPVDLTLTPSCVFDGTAWVCSCPQAGAPVLAVPAGAGPFPAFRMRFETDPGAGGRPGVFRIVVNGCTRLDDSCLNFPLNPTGGEGVATVSALAALKTAITTPPSAAVTLRGDLTVSGGTTLAAFNSDPNGTGITVQAGGLVPTPGLTVESLPGTPGNLSIADSDTSLSALDVDRMFSIVFGMRRETYNEQAGAVTCGAGCDAAAVNALLAGNPGRPVLIPGNVTIDAPIGSAASPVMLVVGGTVTFGAGAGNFYGVIYGEDDNWVVNSNVTVHGGLIAESNLTLSGGGTLTVAYDSTVMRALRNLTGSFVRVPGGWRDFQ